MVHNTYPTLKPRLVAYPTLKPILVEHADEHTRTFFFGAVSIRNSLRSNHFFQAQINYENPPEGNKLNELDKKRPGTSQMSERFGPNFAPGSFAL